jgi:UDP-N-acetyl-2-amino-2-deoxyglucuronate dehydrogenase
MVATKNFAVTGVAGFVAPRHLDAIRETGHRLVAALDPHDSVGILDQFSRDVRFFTEFERFDRYLERLRRGPSDQRVDYLSVCSPNYLHDAHCRFALRIGCDVICEKPLVINPWNLDQLAGLEQESGRRINTVLQLRLHPVLMALRDRLQARDDRPNPAVQLTYVTGRGPWYHVSWKGADDKSGGVAVNIGIHLFDLLIWLFGPVRQSRVFCRDNQRVSGHTELAHADVTWFLSVAAEDLAALPEAASRTTFRSLTIDDEQVEFSDGFADLHTKVYERVLAGGGFTIEDVRPSTELVYRIRTDRVVPPDDAAHPLLRHVLGQEWLRV